MGGGSRRESEREIGARVRHCTSDASLTNSYIPHFYTHPTQPSLTPHPSPIPASHPFQCEYDNPNECNQAAIPSSHSSSGVSGTDFVLYVTMRPTQGSTLAWVSHDDYV